MHIRILITPTIIASTTLAVACSSAPGGTGSEVAVGVANENLDVVHQTVIRENPDGTLVDDAD